MEKGIEAIHPIKRIKIIGDHLSITRNKNLVCHEDVVVVEEKEHNAVDMARDNSSMKQVVATTTAMTIIRVASAVAEDVAEVAITATLIAVNAPTTPTTIVTMMRMIVKMPKSTARPLKTTKIEPTTMTSRTKKKITTPTRWNNASSALSSSNTTPSARVATLTVAGTAYFVKR